MNALIIIISLFFQDGTFEILDENGERIASSAVNNGNGEYIIGSSSYLNVSGPSNTSIEYIEVTHVREGMGIESVKTDGEVDMTYFNEKLTTKDAMVVVVRFSNEKGESKSLYYVLKPKKPE